MAGHNYNCKDDPWVRLNFSKLDFAQNFFELDHLNCAGMRRCWSSWSKWRWQGLRMKKEWWSFIACFLLPFEWQSLSILTIFCYYDCPGQFLYMHMHVGRNYCNSKKKSRQKKNCKRADPKYYSNMWHFCQWGYLRVWVCKCLKCQMGKKGRKCPKFCAKKWWCSED